VRVAGVLFALAVARVAALWDHQLVWSPWSPVAYLWQDAASVLVYAAADRMLRRTPAVAWTAYAVVVAYIAIGVPVMRIMSTPMTWTMWRAAGGALSDSIWMYATAANLSWIAAVGTVALAGPVVAQAFTPAAAAPSVRRSPERSRYMLAIVAAWAAAGPLAVARVDTHGLDRNAWSALAIGVMPRVTADASTADWRVGRHPRAAREDLTAFRGFAANRNVILVSLESTAAQYLALYEGPAHGPAPTILGVAPAYGSAPRTLGVAPAYGPAPPALGVAPAHGSTPPTLGVAPAHRPAPPTLGVAPAHGSAPPTLGVAPAYGPAPPTLGVAPAATAFRVGADPRVRPWDDPTPTLSALARSAIVFDNAYAVYPESIKGLFSVLCSAYPAFDVSAERLASTPCRSIAARLADRGYRTALFHSGRFGYLGMDAVVRDRGYQLLADAGDIGGEHESSFGVDDRATAARILHWIDAIPKGGRFFVTYLPIAGHHPYEAPEPGPFPADDEFGRYRNALRYGDAALGDLVRGLEARGLDRDTVWILFGDHGEAFGQHDGNFGHTFQLYEENVHVPLVIAAPGAIARRIHAARVVSLVDMAPTVLDLVGLPAENGYQGRSVLDGGARPALFFTDYSLGLLGLRDGPLKYIYELDSGRSRLFDLDRDPREADDIAGSRGDDVRWYSERLRAWSAAQKARIH
jgi:Sulfatase